MGKEKKSIILKECIFEIIKPGRNLKKNNILDFLFCQIQIEGDPEKKFLDILEHYDDSLKHLKHFSFELNIYQWILEKFGPSSIINSKCFNEILSTKSYLDSVDITVRSIELPDCIYDSFIKLYNLFIQ